MQRLTLKRILTQEKKLNRFMKGITGTTEET